MKRRRKPAQAPDPYLDFLRHLPCMRCGRNTYGGVHHQQGAGMALKSDHRHGMPLCGPGTTGCHGDLHGLCGSFKGWLKEERREWEQERVKDLNQLWEAQQELKATWQKLQSPS